MKAFGAGAENTAGVAPKVVAARQQVRRLRPSAEWNKRPTSDADQMDRAREAGSTAMTKTYADCVRLLPDRRLGSFHRLRDIDHRCPRFRMGFELQQILFSPWFAGAVGFLSACLPLLPLTDRSCIVAALVEPIRLRLSTRSPSTPSAAKRSCQRQTQVLDLPVSRISISQIVLLSAEGAKRHGGGIPSEEMKKIEWAKIPLQRPANPSEIAAAFHFLASPESSYLTGAVLDVNGGCGFY